MSIKIAAVVNPTFLNSNDLFQASTPSVGPNYRPGTFDKDNRSALLERSEEARYQETQSFLSARMALQNDIAQFSSRQPMKTADHRSFRQMRSEDEPDFSFEASRFADIRITQQLFTAAPMDMSDAAEPTRTETRVSSRLRSERRPRPVADTGESSAPATDREPVRHGSRRDILLGARHLPLRARKVMRLPVLPEDDILELHTEPSVQLKTEAAGKPRW